MPPQPCKPFTPCWCELHPNNPNCTPSVPINGLILTPFTVIGGIILGIFFIWLDKKYR